MHVITPTSAQKTLNIVPRYTDNTPDLCVFRDDTTNTDQVFTIDGFTELEYFYELLIDVNVDLIENHWYDMFLYYGNTMVYYDKVFVTSQNLDTFSVNNYPNNLSQYVPNVTTNEYITYE
jgi:hypothetical protein